MPISNSATIKAFVKWCAWFNVNQHAVASISFSSPLSYSDSVSPIYYRGFTMAVIGASLTYALSCWLGYASYRFVTLLPQNATASSRPPCFTRPVFCFFACTVPLVADYPLVSFIVIPHDPRVLYSCCGDHCLSSSPIARFAFAKVMYKIRWG